MPRPNGEQTIHEAMQEENTGTEADRIDAIRRRFARADARRYDELAARRPQLRHVAV